MNEMDMLLGKLVDSGKKYDIEKIKSAYEYAAMLHEGQKRQSGEDYICHPIAVAEVVFSLGLDTDSICAALLHDTVEDCSEKTNIGEIKKRFGEDVATIVDGLTKIVYMQLEDKEEAHIENIRKMLLAMSKDIRVIFIKLCDRLHNMRTLSAKSDEKRRAIALETMYVYAPLAHRLGIQSIKHELENIGLMYLDPIGYDEVTKCIDKRFGQTSDFIENAKALISDKLRENDIEFELKGRVKSVYSLYRKMYDQNKNFEDIFDFYALRIIVNTELECYTVLGIIHELFHSVPGRFKDYISTPKPNMYQSLHTTVISRHGIPFEVQIRTHKMHEIAEYGIAAHWKYKSGEKASEELDEKIRWVSQMVENDESMHDPDEFMRSFKTDIFRDETFVFTPKGDVISLPLGATVIDFAYAIHTAVGNKMTGAKINGTIVPIDRVPEMGDVVEIITSSSSKGPSRDWMKIVKTSEARNKIRQWYKKEKRAENILVGKTEIEKEVKRYGKSYTDEELQQVISNVASRMGMNEIDDFYNTIGYGGMSVSRLSVRIHDEFERIVKEKTPPPAEPAEVKLTERPRATKNNSGIVVDGDVDCQVKFARCCNPLPGDDVIGFITKGYGISIHHKNCPNAIAGINKPEQKDRWINARWDNEFVVKSGNDIYEANLQIIAENKIGVFADISTALAEMKVSIIGINTQMRENGASALISLTVGCKNISHFKSIVARIKALPAIYEVTRGIVN
jgi:GTP pyrophosphokinase